MEGEALDASIIEKAIAQSVLEPNEEDISDEGEDDVDAYVDDGVVAPVLATNDEADDDFFA